ncbi:MAG: endonuclease/exonuclease/phosphatase family protein, partial [Planctomycetota bacterium]
MTSSGEDAKSASSALRRAQSLLCGAIVLACCSYLVLAALGRVHYLGELACMFRYDFGILAAAGVPFLVLLRRWWMAAFVALVTGWAVWPEASLGLRAQPGAFEPRSPRLRVTLANVLRPNPRHDAVIDAVLATKPDVIGLLEVSIPWRNAALARLGDEYPFRVEGLNTGDEWTEHTWGMILFSKTGFASSKVTPIEHWQRSLRPVVEARMDAPIPVTFQIAHPERPGRRDRLAARRKALVALGDADIEGERILMGDLNTTST